MTNIILAVWVVAAIFAYAAVYMINREPEPTPRQKAKAQRWALMGATMGPVTLACILLAVLTLLLCGAVERLINWANATDVRG